MPLHRRLLVQAGIAATAVGCLRAQASSTTDGGGLGLPPELRDEMPDARLQGSARLRFLGISVYDARLWSAQRVEPERVGELPFALELEYARGLAGSALADRSLVEMRRQGVIPEAQAERWLGAMRRLFPDVSRGDRLTGVQQPGRAARFFHNGSLRGEVVDAEFTRRFFGIWLAPQTSQPEMRAQLLGRAG